MQKPNNIFDNHHRLIDKPLKTTTEESFQSEEVKYSAERDSKNLDSIYQRI